MPRGARLLSLVLVAVVATLTNAPGAAAHGGHGGFSQGQAVGDNYVGLELPTAPFPLTGTPLNMGVIVSKMSGQVARDVEGIAVNFTGPANQSLAPPARSEVPGYYTVNVTFPSTGAWRSVVTLLPSGLQTKYSFEVYGPSPYVIASAKAETETGDAYLVGTKPDVQLLVTDWRTSMPGPSPSDATARVERWTDDHATKLSEKVAPLVPAGPGRLDLREPFDEPGMYHVFVQSPTLKLAYDDRPYVHVYAVAPDRASEFGLEAPKETPSTGVLVALGTLAGVALARRERAQ